jgi:hypothetical protein
MAERLPPLPNASGSADLAAGRLDAADRQNNSADLLAGAHAGLAPRYAWTE